MKNTEQFIKEFIDSGRAGDVALSIGNREGETYRFFHSARGDVQDGKTIYDMMSVSKIMVTTPLFYMAMDEGLASPDDKLGKYFPEAPDDKRDIPLWMLLSHQSGMGRYVNPEYFPPHRRQDCVNFQLSHPLLFEPGTNYFYSCSAFIILGILLERIYNKPLDLLFNDKVARPLGLKNTMFNHPEDENLVRCTRKAFEGNNKCSDDNCRRLYGVAGNAGIFSGLDDMAVFARSLLNRHSTLISEETFAKGTKDYGPHLTFGRALGYVYVDERYKQGGGLYSNGSVGHTGFSGTECYADFEKNLFVVSLSNTARFAAQNKKDCSAECAAFREGLHKAIAKDLNY
ncbi:MAG: beta-lactamase family protein [Clostridia bacterium]|nr:beta-lactamase family protein [Clostridia bacterium]